MYNFINCRHVCACDRAFGICGQQAYDLISLEAFETRSKQSLRTTCPVTGGKHVIKSPDVDVSLQIEYSRSRPDSPPFGG